MAVLPDALAIKRLLAHNETLRILRTDRYPSYAQHSASTSVSPVQRTETHTRRVP